MVELSVQQCFDLWSVDCTSCRDMGGGRGEKRREIVEISFFFP